MNLNIVISLSGAAFSFLTDRVVDCARRVLPSPHGKHILEHGFLGVRHKVPTAIRPVPHPVIVVPEVDGYSVLLAEKFCQPFAVVSWTHRVVTAMPHTDIFASLGWDFAKIEAPYEARVKRGFPT